MEAGHYGYGLNIVLDARTDALNNNSKRVERNFLLKSVTCALSGGTLLSDGFAIILGTERFDWFSDYIICANIFGDGSLPHFLPGEGTLIEKGDFIVAQTKNLDAEAKRIALLFQGIHV